MVVELINRTRRSIVLSDLPAMIGRSQTADVVLDDSGVGEFQSMIALDEGTLRVADLTGGGGTFVNGIRVRTSCLKPGDRLTVGKSDFEVQYKCSKENKPEISQFA
jgi:pSer/pThr/pTyr-binding forkhead associated (FHA) protein